LSEMAIAAARAEAKPGGTELNCGDLVQHMQPSLPYAVRCRWPYPPLKSPWPSVQRRIPLPAQAQDAQGRLAPRPGALLCAAAHHHWEKVPQEMGNLPGPSPQPLRRAARV
jgi:hypothetical protein